MNYFKMCYENGSDFYEMESGNLFHIAEYKRYEEYGIPNPYGGIRVTNGPTSEIVGIVKESDIRKLLGSN